MGPIRCLYAGVVLTPSMLWACGAADQSNAQREPTTFATIEARIGEAEGPEEYLFGAVTGLAADESHIFVADQQADVIRAYDWSGRYLHTVAIRGGGPGEVRRPCCLSIDPAGQLWVRDAGNGRYNAYRVSGQPEFVRSVRMSHTSAGYFVAPSFLPNGDLVDVGYIPDDEGVFTQRRFVVNSEGVVVHSEAILEPPNDSVPVHRVTREVRGGVSTMFFQQPFGPAHLVAHGVSGSYATAVSSIYQIRWINRPEQRDTLISANLSGDPVTSAERDSALAVWRERLEFSNLRPADMPFGVADYKPVLRFLQFDALGRLWVHLTPTDQNLARVHNRNGTAVAVVAWPSDIDLRYGYILDHAAFGIARDSLGVQQVVRMSY